jgi:hypothetical protein
MTNSAVPELDESPDVRLPAVAALETCREFPMTLIKDPTLVR